MPDGDNPATQPDIANLTTKEVISRIIATLDRLALQLDTMTRERRRIYDSIDPNWRARVPAPDERHRCPRSGSCGTAVPGFRPGAST